jgi:L-ribulose-5-phosphate 3-epimerase
MKLSTFYDHIITIKNQNGLSIEEIAKELNKLGIESVEIANTALNDESRKNLKILADFGITVASYHAYCDFIHDPSVEAADEILKQAEDIGAKIILVIPGFLKPEDDRETAMQTALSPFCYLCEKAAERGITVGIEEYDNDSVTLLNSDEMLWFLKRVPGLSCIFDTGNFFYCGEDTLHAYNALKQYITAQVHLKDRKDRPAECDGEQYRQDGSRMYPSAIGDGVIPIKQIICDLKSRGFDGTFTIEIYNSADMLGDIKKSAEFISKVW